MKSFKNIIIAVCVLFNTTSMNAQYYKKSSKNKAQVKTDSVYTVIRELVSPTTKITRTAKLNYDAKGWK